MLTIVIPALNEEQSIASISRRCLEQAPRIREETGHDIELIVIDDGSTDRTAELARAIEGVEVVSLPHNRGYGAALMEGFRRARGELIGFLDADETCDPAFFVPLIRAVHAGASVACGNRLGADSHMPTVRRIGNRFFAWLIRKLSGTTIEDSASGMRVFRRSCLELLLPLPTGLSLTPAMSCRAALDPRLRIVEIPITYAQRAGRSKLGVVRDGVRFLAVILQIAMTYRPMLLFGTAAAASLLLAVAYAIEPVLTSLATGTLGEDQVYRVLAILVLTAGGLAFAYAGALAAQVQEFVNPSRRASPLGRCTRRMLFARPFSLAVVCFAVALAASAESLQQYVTQGRIDVHWIYVAFGTLLVMSGVQLVAFGVLQRLFVLLAQRLELTRPLAVVDGPRPENSGRTDRAA